MFLLNNNNVGQTSLKDALLMIQNSNNASISDMNLIDCNFQMSRAIDILSSYQIKIISVSIINSSVEYNNLIYFSGAKNISISDVKIKNISHSTPSK